MRALFASTLAAVALVAVPSPARAATVVHHVDDLPADWNAVTLDCETRVDQGFLGTAVEGPGDPLAGAGSLKLASGPGEVSVLARAHDGPVSDLTALAADVHGASTGFVVQVVVRAADGSHTVLVGTPPALSSGWAAYDLMGLTYSWFDGQTAIGTGTIADYVVSGNELGVETKVDLVNHNCGGSSESASYLDSIDVAFGDALGPYDVEWDGLPPAAVETIAASRTKTVAGTAVKLTTTLTSASGRPVAGAAVSLFAAHQGTTDFARVGGATTSSLGVAALSVKPLVNTTYEWRYDGPFYAPTTSGPLTVGVRSKVTAVVVDDTLRKGQALVVTGKATPARPGGVIYLQRRTASGLLQLKKGLVNADGTYRISWLTRAAGDLVVQTRVPSDATNLPGRSPWVGASVR